LPLTRLGGKCCAFAAGRPGRRAFGARAQMLRLKGRVFADFVGRSRTAGEVLLRKTFHRSRGFPAATPAFIEAATSQ